MRRIDRAGQFKRDYKREAKGQYRATLDADLMAVLKALATDQSLAERYHDHSLADESILDYSSEKTAKR
ncbi:type II toxin-antitoxin system YafQ family toxin [Herbaspirillum rubrisubalbicans]|uniref:type II toxin-antitoxin system YafQ family toxin n=1 Tax=Herbaspirillum rubrisubalbicans TaxID=80842 RepID=UPI000DD40FB1